MRLLVAILLALGASLAAHAQPADEAQAEARYRALINELRCLVCQNQTIADSDAPLAADLRQQVRQQIAAGRSDAEIKQYVTARYGDFVLYRPPFKPSTLLLWAGPFVLLLVALAVALRRLLRRRPAAAPAAPAPDPEALRRLLDEDRR